MIISFSRRQHYVFKKAGTKWNNASSSISRQGEGRIVRKGSGGTASIVKMITEYRLEPNTIIHITKLGHVLTLLSIK